MLVGALKLMVACVLVATAVTPVGAPGTVAGVTEFDALRRNRSNRIYRDHRKGVRRSVRKARDRDR